MTKDQCERALLCLNNARHEARELAERLRKDGRFLNAAQEWESDANAYAAAMEVLRTDMIAAK